MGIFSHRNCSLFLLHLHVHMIILMLFLHRGVGGFATVQQQYPPSQMGPASLLSIKFVPVMPWVIFFLFRFEHPPIFYVDVCYSFSFYFQVLIRSKLHQYLTQLLRFAPPQPFAHTHGRHTYLLILVCGPYRNELNSCSLHFFE